MKVLWFTNTPSLAEEYLDNKTTGGGWIKSLEKEMKAFENIDLGIVFYYNKLIKPFQYLDTEYFPIYAPSKNKYKRLVSRIRGNIEDENDLENAKRIINKFQPDIIHILGTELPFGLLQNFHSKIPFVVSIQGNITVYEYKYFSGIPKFNVSKYSSLFNRLMFNSYNDAFRSFKKRAIREREIFDSSENIIGRTNWDKRITRVFSPNSKYFHNDEILRDSLYLNKWDNDLTYPLNIFSTTGSNLYKGIEVIIYSANLLDKLNISYKWNIAGLMLESQLIHLASKSIGVPISKNIIFMGNLSEQQLVTALLNSHLYVMPSHIENSPNSLCEAMILGLPCIASDVGGTSSLLKDSVEGFLIQDGDPWMLTGSIIELVSNYNVAKKFGHNARKRALERHNPDKITNELLEIYSTVIKNNITKNNKFNHSTLKPILDRVN